MNDLELCTIQFSVRKNILVPYKRGQYPYDGKQYYAFGYASWSGLYDRYDPIKQNNNKISLYKLQNIIVKSITYTTTYTSILGNYTGIKIIDDKNNTYTITCGKLYDNSLPDRKVEDHDFG